jgi:hypothetical protein
MHRNQSLTAHLGERVRSALPGYTVSLASSPLVGTEDSAPRRAVVVDISRSALQCVCWVADADNTDRAWASRVVEIRVALRSEEFGGNVVAVVGTSVDIDDLDSSDDFDASVDFDPSVDFDASVDDSVHGNNDDAIIGFDLAEILAAVKETIEVDLVALVPDLDPPVAEELGRALRIYVNDPIRG